MTDMTMGQRIAVQRKLKNLSQEALAEQLEVSRQAVSKWESDAAIPEVDKLIALGKIFGVSVGWLLGTEKELTEEVEFTEAQIRAVEEIVSRSVPKKRNWFPWVVCLALAVLAVWGFRRPVAAPEAENTLTVQMDSLQSQIDDLQDSLEKHMAESDILLSISCYDAVADEGLLSATVDFYFVPKVYRQEDKAYLMIENAPNVVYGVRRIPCKWTGDRYEATVTLDRWNGYSYSFRLENADGFQEQNLMRPDLIDRDFIANISDNMAFRILPDHPKYAQMAKSEHAWLDVNLETYTYDAPILTPRIFPENGRGYKSIEIKLQLNDQLIWQESYLDTVMKHTGGHVISIHALPLDISVDLPELAYGDKLKLWLEAEVIDGTVLYTPLDELFAWERPE